MGYYDPPETYESEIDYECEAVVGFTYIGEPVTCDYEGAVVVYSSDRHGEYYEGECPKCGTTFDGSTTPDTYDGLPFYDR